MFTKCSKSLMSAPQKVRHKPALHSTWLGNSRPSVFRLEQLVQPSTWLGNTEKLRGMRRMRDRCLSEHTARLTGGPRRKPSSHQSQFLAILRSSRVLRLRFQSDFSLSCSSCGFGYFGFGLESGAAAATLA